LRKPKSKGQPDVGDVHVPGLSGGVSWEDLVRAHRLILAEMARRGLEHQEAGPLDRESLSKDAPGAPMARGSGQDGGRRREAGLASVLGALGADSGLPDEVMVVPDFVSVVGSQVSGQEGADLDILFRADRDAGKFAIPAEGVEVAVRKALDPGKGKALHFIAESTGPHADYLPQYDLVLRRKESAEVVKVRKSSITFEEESEIIRENQKKPEAQKPHKFQAAQWTHKNGHPRCLLCGEEESVDGMCSGEAARQAVKKAMPPEEIEPGEGETTGEQAANFWKDNWWKVLPKSGRGNFIIQAHFRGLTEDESKLGLDDLLQTDHSLHYDIRLTGEGGDLWGFTMFAGKTSDNRPPRIFRLDGQKLQAQPKKGQPKEWLEVGSGKGTVSEPGESGATAGKYAKFFALDRGDYSLDTCREHAISVFLHGGKLKGRMIFAYAPLGGSKKWVASMPADQKPYSETHDKEKVLAEIKAKGQKHLVWCDGKSKPEFLEVKSAGEAFQLAWGARKSKSPTKSTWLIPIVKTELEKQIVYGVVLEPDTEDSQGDTVSPEEIEQSMHRFMAKYRRTGVEHSMRISDGVDIVESFIAPQAIDYNGQAVKKGSWVMGVHVEQPSLWAAIKAGKFTGFSIYGFAERE